MGGSIGWFIDNPRVANLLAMVLIVGGLLAIPNTRQETLPNVPLERIGVVSKLDGSPPEVIEQLLCTPLETAIEGIEGVTDMRSEAREGVCSITVDVLEGYDSKAVRDLMASRTAALDTLPAEADRPVVEEVIFRNRVARVLVTGEARPRELYNIARDLRRGLLAEPEIVQVEVEGMPSRELAIEVPRQELYRYQLTFGELADGIMSDISRITGGLLRTEESNALLQAGQRIYDPEAYRQVEVRRGDDGDVLVLDRIAHLDDGFGRDAMGAWLNGQPAAALDVYRVGEQDVVAVARAVREFMDKASLPEGMRLVLWEDGAVQYESRSQLLWSNALQGFALLLVILGSFLGLRLAGWVGLGIPVSMLGACILLPLLGESFNTISLFAFILVLGIVVDDATVVGESIYEQVQRDGATRAAVIAGTQRVAKPVVYAILTTVLAFVPMLFLPGPEGEFMRVVPIVAISILCLSLVESLWILPTHLLGSAGRRPDRSDRFAAEVNRRFDAWVLRRFMPFVRWGTRQRYPILVAFAGVFLFACSLLHSGWLSVQMFSRVHGEIVMADVSFPEGTSSARVAQAVESLQRSAQQLAEVLNSGRDADLITDIYAEQGRRNKYSTAHDAGAYLRARVSLGLAPTDESFDADSVARKWRQLQQPIKGAVSLRFHASLNEVKPDIHINLFHDDLAILETMSEELYRELTRIDGTREIASSMSARFTRIDILPRPGAAHAGITREELGRQVNAAFHGTVVDRMPEGDHDVPVVLRLPASQSNSLWDLEQLPIALGDGTVAPLGALAELRLQTTPAVVSHFDAQRSATLTAYVDDHQVSHGQVMAQLKQGWLAEMPQVYPGARWSEAGKPKAIDEFMSYLTVAYVLAVLGMFVVLTIAFGSYWQPVIILSAVPFGLVGGFLGHAVLGYDLTLWSIVGAVAVSGVVINDNLVLVSAVNELCDAGRTMRQAALEAIGQRFRPVFLTTATTFVGVAPLILEQSTQARFLAPMAIAVAFGVLFATFVTLLMVPCLCIAGDDIRRLVTRLTVKRHKASEKDSVEQAYRVGQQAGLSPRRSSSQSNPYADEVLRASWEAGLNDPEPDPDFSDKPVIPAGR